MLALFLSLSVCVWLFFFFKKKKKKKRSQEHPIVHACVRLPSCDLDVTSACFDVRDLEASPGAS